MITVYSEKHFLRNVRTELHGGELVPPHECSQRAEFVLERVEATGLGDVIAPADFGLEPLFVLEGGYAVAEIGVNAVNVLEGFG